MFVIAIRLKGSGAPSDVIRDALPVSDHAFQLKFNRDSQWTTVALGETGEVGEIYTDLEDAIKDFKAVMYGVNNQQDSAAPLLELISVFKDQYQNRKSSFNVSFEIQALTPTTIKSEHIDLDAF